MIERALPHRGGSTAGRGPRGMNRGRARRGAVGLMPWLFALGASLVLSAVAGANSPTYTWVGGAVAGPSSWDLPENWSPPGVPGEGDAVVLTAGTLNSGTTTRRVAALTVQGGVLQGGHLLVSGSFTWSAGVLHGPGTLTIEAGAAASFVGPGNKILARRLENAGNASYTGNSVALGQHTTPGIIANLPDATLAIPDGGSFFINGAVNNQFINRGQITKTGLNASFINVPFTNLGSIRIERGQLVAAGSLINAGSLRIDPGALLSVGGDFTQTPSGIITCVVTGAGVGQVGRLAASGSAYLAGSLVVQPGPTIAFTGCRTTAQLIVADGQVAGRFQSVTLPEPPAGLAVFLTYADTSMAWTAGSPADIARTDSSVGGDGLVNNGDFNLFISGFFGAEGTPAHTAADIASTDADPGNDGTVDNGDFMLFIGAFFAGCP